MFNTKFINKMKTIFLSVIVFITCTSFGNTQHDVSLFYPWILQSCIRNCSWTIWFNIGKPYNSTSGDNEDTAEIIAQNPNTMCKAPIGIEAQSINYQTGNWEFEWRWTETTDNISLVSFYSTEPAGVDFRVRYCCSRDAFISSTTTKSTPSDSSTCGIGEIAPELNIKSQIYGEVEAIANSWPWMIYIRKQIACVNQNCSTECGAILIDKDHVITAALCITTADTENITLIAGAHNLSSTTETVTRQVRSIKQIFFHPDYNSSSVDSNIVVLRVNASFTFTKYVQPACLPDDDIEPNEEVIVIGWGNEQFDGTSNGVLKQIYTTVVSNCSSDWPHIDSTQQLCVSDSISRNSVCHNNGSEAIMMLIRGQYVVSGVASFAKEWDILGNSSKPNVYTRVAAYKTWIKSITQ